MQELTGRSWQDLKQRYVDFKLERYLQRYSSEKRPKISTLNSKRFRSVGPTPSQLKKIVQSILDAESPVVRVGGNSFWQNLENKKVPGLSELKWTTLQSFYRNHIKDKIFNGNPFDLTERELIKFSKIVIRLIFKNLSTKEYS